ncbi:MAG: S-layer homology domain-containing protein, partial [Oscillospiraceae bacterium]|nr:S-layer homology domain-containing protein [Oscillospiraceae bacterium]
YSSWSATPYTLIGSAVTTLTISVGGVTKTTNCYCFYEPDIHVLFGGGTNISSYTEAIEQYQTTFNADYDPAIINTVTTSSERTDGLGNAYNMFEMSTNMTDVGMLADETAASLGKTTRYAESAAEIGSNYDKWCRGFYYWAQLMFEVYDGSLTMKEYNALQAMGVDMDALGGGLEKVRGVTSYTYTKTTSGIETWELYPQTSRQTQYANGIVEDVYDVLAAEYAELGDEAPHQPTQHTSTSGMGGGGQGSSGSTTTAYVLTTEELIDYLNPDGQKNSGFLLNSSSSLSDDVIATLEEANIKVFSNLPTTVYGITMQARENALGQPYYLAYIYYDQLSAMTNVDMTLNPISLVFYWMENFYHVSDTDAMQTVIVNMLEDADLPSGLVVTNSATTDSYGSGVAEDIENMIILGMKYYLCVEEPRLEEAGEEMEVTRDDTGATTSANTNWAYWFSLNGKGYEDVLTMGIGSDDEFLNPSGNGVANRNLNAQKYASDGTAETFYTENSSYMQDGTSEELQTYDNTSSSGSSGSSSSGSSSSGSSSSGGSSSGGSSGGGLIGGPTTTTTTTELNTTPIDIAATEVMTTEEATTAVEAMTDVDSTAYYYDATLWAVQNGVTSGVSDESFSPDTACTRAQIVTFLYRLAGSPAVSSSSTGFNDVPLSQYYYDAVQWAVENGITNGVGDGEFGSDDVCTRAQIVTFLYRFAGQPDTSTDTAFTDVSSTDYYAAAVAWAAEQGITTGTSDTTFSSADSCTRAQVVTFLYRFAQG